MIINKIIILNATLGISLHLKPSTIQEEEMFNPIYKQKGLSSNELSFDTKNKLFDSCLRSLFALPGEISNLTTNKICRNVKHLNKCYSVNNEPIFHGEYLASRPKAKRILVIALIHGDEIESGSVARHWMARLQRINSRSTWRIIPVLNPDGLKRKTRTNQNRVDLNRNFPTANWNTQAIEYWKKKKKSNGRHYPGPYPSSEPETTCAINHISDFKPDFIISIHTPYGVLDFDGPKINFPKFKEYPWVSLGTFPGSLGRYMWTDRQIPVLTVELRNSQFLSKLDRIDVLQDTLGTVAIKANNKVEK